MVLSICHYHRTQPQTDDSDYQGHTSRYLPTYQSTERTFASDGYTSEVVVSGVSGGFAGGPRGGWWSARGGAGARCRGRLSAAARTQLPPRGPQKR